MEWFTTSNLSELFSANSTAILTKIEISVFRSADIAKLYDKSDKIVFVSNVSM